MAMSNTVIMPDFEIHTTPLEHISIDANSIEITLDDIFENRCMISAKPYQAVRIITIDCVSSVDYHNEFNYRDGRCHRHILQIDTSEFVDELKKNGTETSFLDEAKHFAIPMQDNVIEVIAYELKVEMVR